jgi:hypothetical protein
MSLIKKVRKIHTTFIKCLIINKDERNNRRILLLSSSLLHIFSFYSDMCSVFLRICVVLCIYAVFIFGLVLIK